MIIPNFENIQFITKGGVLTDSWQNILQALFTALQNNLSNEGFHIPQQTTANIGLLQTRFAAAPDPTVYFGVMLYDTDTDELKVNINGTFRVITVV